MDMAILVQAQGEQLDSIEAQVLAPRRRYYHQKQSGNLNAAVKIMDSLSIKLTHRLPSVLPRRSPPSVESCRGLSRWSLWPRGQSSSCRRESSKRRPEST
jgi:hypothetical protein